MPEADVDPGVHRRKLRSVLRQLREACGKTQSETAAEMFWSVSKLIRIESGSVTISPNDLRALVKSYGVSDEATIESLVELARLARGRSWLSEFRDVASDEFLAYLAYEEMAVRSHNFQPVLVPGPCKLKNMLWRLYGPYEDQKSRADWKNWWVCEFLGKKKCLENGSIQSSLSAR